jgi:hypothetical protein
MRMAASSCSLGRIHRVERPHGEAPSTILARHPHLFRPSLP